MSAVLTHIFSLVLDASLAATILLAIVLLAQLCLGKLLCPSWRYILLIAVVVRLLIPAVPETGFSIFNLTVKRRVPPPISTLPVAPDIIKIRPFASLPSSQPQRITVATAAPVIWLSGVVIWLALLGIQHQRTAKWVSRLEPITDPVVLEILTAVRQKLRLARKVRIVRTASDMAPALFGSINPVLLLPEFALRDLTREELRLVFLHELLHIKRHDLLLNSLSVLARALHWFNPAAWFLVRQIRIERELACDEHVLRIIRADDQRLYGNLLLKIVDEFATPPRQATLIPIIQRKPKIQRRINMISNYKPLPWTLSIVSALVLAIAALLTFTRAADKPPAAKPSEKQDQISDKERASASTLKNLTEQVDRQRALVRDLQEKADNLRLQLGIIDSDPKGTITSETERLRRLESLHMEARSERERNATLYSYLTNLGRADLKSAALSAVPDPLLSSLLQQQQNTEQKLADVTENHGAEHPEVKGATRVLAQINKQIDDRLQAITRGIKTRVDIENVRAESLQNEIMKLRDLTIARSIQSRPYYDTLRELELQQQVLDRLKVRVADEKINSAFAK